jgi:hypothetical protein
VLVGWIALLCGVIVSLVAVGRDPSFELPGLGDIGPWIERRDAATALFALLRVAALGAGWYLLALTLAALVLRLVHADGAARVLERRLAPRAVGRIVRAALGVSVAASSFALPSVAGATDDPAPVVTMRRLESAATTTTTTAPSITMHRIDAPSSGEERLQPQDAPAADGRRPQPTTATSPSAATPPATAPLPAAPHRVAAAAPPTSAPAAAQQPVPAAPSGGVAPTSPSTAGPRALSGARAGADPARRPTPPQMSPSQPLSAAASGSGVPSARSSASDSRDGDPVPGAAGRPAVVMRRLADPPASERPQTPAAADADNETWAVVRPGDHFWAIAEQRLAEAWQRRPTAREIDPYWRTLVEQNRSLLRDPGNPDLLFPGDRIRLPLPPASTSNRP